MPRILLLLVGIAVGALAIFFLQGSEPEPAEPPELPEQPKPQIEVEGAEVYRHGLSRVSRKLEERATQTLPSPTSTYSDSSQNTILAPPPPDDLVQITQQMVPKPLIKNPDRVFLSNVVRRPSSELLDKERTGPSITGARAAKIFPTKALDIALLAGLTRAHHPKIASSDFTRIFKLLPPEGLEVQK